MLKPIIPITPETALRRQIAERYLTGSGIEIGALHVPLEIPTNTTVRYLDKMTVADLKKHYPELVDYELVEVDIIDDGETLSSIADSSIDFVIANHMIEHCQNPIKTIEHHLRVLKPGGILYMGVPDKRYTFDCDRPVTSLEHLIRDAEEPEWSMHSHFEEWNRLVNKVPEDQIAVSTQHLIDINFSIHFHVWTQVEFLELLLYCQKNLRFTFEIELLQKNGVEFIAILSKVVQALKLGIRDMNILDEYVTLTPNPQNALDIFKGEWSSKLPEPLAKLQTGSVPLFEDSRIEWGVTQLGGVEGKTVLELGPLEAGHSYMLERFGAAGIVSIEANTRAYLKCLIVKELLDLKRTSFLCGDFVEYLRTNQTKFDICIACGVLYHMRNPTELVALAAKASDRLFIWTHYYDQAIISKNPNLAHKFSSGIPNEYAGFQHTLYRQEYKAALDWTGFCGGSEVFSHWLSRDDIIACLRHFGLNDIQTNFEAPDHPNGPSFGITAVRSY